MNHFYPGSDDFDREKAIYWCLKAAEQGDVEAQGLLGEHYNMDSEPRDYDQAIYWFTKAAEQGDVVAQYNLGCMYHNIRKDKNKAIYWCTKAAEQGNAQAKEKLEKWEQHSGGCYVATAVYGSYDCPQVWTLRRYRDFTLAESLFGRAFIRLYYALSPTLVKWFGKKMWFNHLWRSILDRKIANLRKHGINDTPYVDKV
ncbi:hypothetical protein AGMMS49546_38690 [Spirochaetia bacterium]|nr:hypothetical protein AGMMS49546_38690 [Spirochaetia bacterium]